jgi:phage shock protein PspC (stress-responsive transcriptional regulator)
MQRIIQINIAGRVIPIEEDAYSMLKAYITSLESQFTGADGKEILDDIENRIAELFGIRLENGSPAIDKTDVQKVIDTLGYASDINQGAGRANNQNNRQYTNTGNAQWTQAQRPNRVRLLRDPFDKVIGGVCSGVAHYFEIDPVIIRLVMAILFLFAGIGFLAYLIAWAVIPAATSREELYNMNNGQPVTFHDISRNLENEMQDLKKRGEQMSRELKDFFSKKK